MKTTSILAIAAFAAFTAAWAFADDSFAFAYNGCIRNTDGTSLSKEVTQKSIQVRIWDAPTGGTLLWARSRDIVIAPDGLFTTVFDDSGEGHGAAAHTDLADALSDPAATRFYVEIFVDDAAIEPRQEIIPMAFAEHAGRASSAQGDFTAANIDARTLCTWEIGGTGAISAQTATVSGQLLLQRKTTIAGKASVKGSASFAGDVVALDGAKVEGYGIVPVGGIVPYSGSPSDLPDGWHICDGTGNTPNLKGMFVMGDFAGNSKKSGGAERVALEGRNVPDHSHNGNFQTPSSRTVNFRWTVTENDGMWADRGNGDLFEVKTTTRYGSANVATHENRPPFYALYYIMRVK